jgi:peptide/nickel transport system substrate-binding protein
MLTGPRARRRALIVALVITALPACGDAGSAANALDMVVVGMRSDFDAFNPVVTSSQYGQELNNYALFTPLVQYDERLEPTPWLAESWELLGDTGVVFNLRTDVRWHDGRPVTAADVKFTFDLAKDPVSASLLASAFLADVESAEVVDSHTIRFRFARPHAQAIEDFWWAPLPRHALEGVAAADLKNAPFNRAPIGSGPFRFERWQANQRVVLVSNPDFPAALGGPAAADRVVFRIVPEASTMLTELITGAVDIDIPVPPDQTRPIEKSAGLTLHAFPGRTVYYVGWNNERPPFDDPALRRALAAAIDRREIIETLLYGKGEIATSTIPPAHPLHPDNEPLPYDLADAERRLEQAGWTDGDGDGIREKDGRPLRFTLLSADDALRRAVSEVLQAQLRLAGADVEIRVLEFQTMLQQHRDRDYDAIFTNWVLDNFQVAAAPFALLHTSQAEVPQSANRSGVRIPRLDSLIERGARATVVEAQRTAWGEFTGALQEEQPLTFMFWLYELAASRDEVGGVEMDPRGELRTIARWTSRGSGAAPAGR